MRTTSSLALALASLASACSGGAGPGGDPDAASPVDAAVDAPGEHHARFVGLWAVEQPSHALYEVTYYDLAADGRVTVGPSDPPDCTAHLERHCVTGSVARCTPAEPGGFCQGAPTCLFGDRWHSQGERVLVFAGVCSDQVARDIVIQLEPDTGGNTGWGGAGGTLVSVGGETGWSHDNWPWAFRKCPPGTTPVTCFPP